MAERCDDFIDAKGVGQPFKFHGGKDQDFLEWAQKFTTFVKAKFGADVESAVKWAVQQRKRIEEQSADTRSVGWQIMFGPQGYEPIERFGKIEEGLYTYLMSFTTGVANKVV